MEEVGEEINENRLTFLTQIENACTLSSKDDEIVFMSVNPITKTSYCIATQIGVNFLNNNVLAADLTGSSFVKLFNEYVKANYGVTENEFDIQQRIIPKSADHEKATDLSPLEMHIVTNDETDISQSKLKMETDNLSLDHQVANQNEFTDDKSEEPECTETPIKVTAEMFLNQKSDKIIQPAIEKSHIPEKESERIEDAATTHIPHISKSNKQQEKKETSVKGLTKIDSGVLESVKSTKDATEKRKSSRSEVKPSKIKTKGDKTKASTQETTKSMKSGDTKGDKTNASTQETTKSGDTKVDKTKSSTYETPKSMKSGPKKPSTSAVVISRSGRKVVMPKWRLEDVGDIKEIKTEPQDDEDYGIVKKVEKSYVAKEKKSSVKTKQKEVVELSNRDKNKDKCSTGKESVKKESSKATKRKPDDIEENVTVTKRKCKQNETQPDSEDKITDAALDEIGKSENMIQNAKVKAVIIKTEIESKTGDEDKVKTDTTEKQNEDLNETIDSLIYESIIGDAKEEVDDDELRDLELEEEEEEEEDIKNDLDIDSDSKNTEIWSCSICNSKAKKCWLIRRHMRRMHDLSNSDLKPCRFCKSVKVYEACQECKTKLEEIKLICDICNKSFSSKFQYLRHQECHITEKEIPCNICGKKFRSERYVKMHIYHTHKKRNGKALTAPMEPGICDICGKWFRFKCNAIRHREIHFEEKRFDCPICHMKFRHSSSLKRHKMSHQQKAEYVCEQCGRAFKMKQTLIQHHRVHIKEPFLKCEYCPREFRTYKGKKYHILKDHADKQGDFNFKSFVCEICDKACSSQADYDLHLKTHDASRYYACSVCGSRWDTIAQLKAHRKSHNVSPQRYRCKVCNISFKEASKARAHITKSSHIKNCHAKGLDQTKDNISDITNSEIIEIREFEYSFKDVELQQELNVVSAEVSEMDNIPEEIKVIHIEQSDFGANTAEVQILNEPGGDIMYDEIILNQEEITVDGDQIIYQVEIDGQNTIICDPLTSQAVESILKLQNQS